MAKNRRIILQHQIPSLPDLLNDSYFWNFCMLQYGGDITRKMKLLKAQAEGKKKMRLIGNVEVPKTAFVNILKK